MSVNDFLIFFGHFQWHLAIYFMALPFICVIFTFRYRDSVQPGPRAYLFSGLIYLASLPGVSALMLVSYTLFILRGNLLEVNILLYVLPIVSMFGVYGAIARVANFNNLPGFDRLSGLLIIIALVCLSVFFLYRLHFIIGFFGSIEILIGAALVLFVTFKLAAAKLMGKAK